MTLVDESRQIELIRALDNHMIKRQCGGSAANTMIAASQFGADCFYSCKVANDDWGDFYVNDLESEGVASNLTMKPRKSGLTGTMFGDGYPGRRPYYEYLFGHNIRIFY